MGGRAGLAVYFTGAGAALDFESTRSRKTADSPLTLEVPRMTAHSATGLGSAREAIVGTEERGVCCSLAETDPRARRGRHARAAAGIAFLGLAGSLAGRQLPGRIALWPAALVPTWFGISHLVAAVTGYRGCPELGAIPSVMLGRTIETGCGPW